MLSEIHPLTLLIRNLDGHFPLEVFDENKVRELPHTVRTMPAGAYLVRDGEVPGPCVILISGFAYRQKTSEDGARQIVSIHLPGEALDLQHLYLDFADHNVQALTEVKVAFVPRQSIRDIAYENSSLGKAFSIASLVEASIMREWMLNIGRRDGRKRLAHLLCEFAVRLERLSIVDDYGYELPMSQEWLGDALGLTSVHVNRMIRSLASDGLITHDRRSISFPNWTSLRGVASFNEQYLHLGQQRCE